MKIVIKGILFSPFYMLSYIVKRDKYKFCFGGEGNSKYLFYYYQEKGYRTIWISWDQREVKHMRHIGRESYYGWSLKAFWNSLTAGTYIFTHSIGNINSWACRGARFVHLSHGLPIKKISNDDSFHNKKDVLNKIFTPSSNVKYNIQLTPSECVKKIFARSYNLDLDPFVFSMFPRNLLLMKNKQEIFSFLNKIKDESSLILINKILCYSKTYIYMPSFRDTGRDFLEEARFDYIKLNTLLKKKGELFIFKLHPYTSINHKKDIEQCSNILFLSNSIDMYPILPFTNVLITDYSSIYFDYALIKDSQIILFPFDENIYTVSERRLNIEIQKLPGIHCQTFEELYNVIRLDKIDDADRSDIIKKWWGEKRDIKDLIQRLKKV